MNEEKAKAHVERIQLENEEKAKARVERIQLENEQKHFHERSRSIAERETRCELRERAQNQREKAMNERERDLDRRENDLANRVGVSEEEPVYVPDQDPLRVGDSVQLRGSGPVGRVTRVQRTPDKQHYHVTWPGNKSGTYPRKELTRA